MDKPTSPQANFTALDDERDMAARRSPDPRLERAAAHWENPSGKRKFIPAVVIGVAVAGLTVGIDYKSRHKAEQAPPTVAQGPAVESMINEAPPAAGMPPESSAPATESRLDTTPPDTAPAAAPPPPPNPAPRAEHAAPRTPAPAPRPAIPAPEPMQRSVPSDSPPAVTPTSEASPPAQQAIQPPSPMPAPQPSQEAPGSDKPGNG